MAEKPYRIIATPFDSSGVKLILWENLILNDTGAPFMCPEFSDKSVQVIGTLGAGGNCQIKGSNIKDSPTWATLNDPQGNALDITAAKIETILENVYEIQPEITAGDETTDIDVYLLLATTR
jgi:hypothetical protein